MVSHKYEAIQNQMQCTNYFAVSVLTESLTTTTAVVSTLTVSTATESVTGAVSVESPPHEVRNVTSAAKIINCFIINFNLFLVFIVNIIINIL